MGGLNIQTFSNPLVCDEPTAAELFTEKSSYGGGTVPLGKPFVIASLGPEVLYQGLSSVSMENSARGCPVQVNT